MKLLLGNKIKDSQEYSAKSKLCEVFALVKKGHEECGDSAFVFCNDEKAIVAVFDGVSGEAGAASASSVAAKAILNSLKEKKPTQVAIKEAILEAQGKIKHGLTTAAIMIVDKKGNFIVAGVGDSPIYGINAKGEIDLEIPLGRPVGDKNSILKFFHFRSLVTSVLGPSGSNIELNMRKGQLKKGEMMILASDGLIDNLYVTVHKGYLVDSSGKADLKKLLSSLKKPETIVRKLANVIKYRIQKGKVEKKGTVLVPKVDDIAIIALRWL
jgi:serine/threonine protein phosphatase PrpC